MGAGGRGARRVDLPRCGPSGSWRWCARSTGGGSATRPRPFARAWYRALRPGQPEGDAYKTWRQAKEEEGQKALDRFVADWAELRACLEIAAANQLDVALLHLRMSGRAFDGYEVVSDERIGEGGFLSIRRVRLRVRRGDGTLSKQGLYDFVERPMGKRRGRRRAVASPRADGAVDVLLRHAPRVPLWFRDRALGAAHTEVVAGILEHGEDDWPAIQRRAAAEAHEEAGMRRRARRRRAPGPAQLPHAGHVRRALPLRRRRGAPIPAPPRRRPTDGSPFEEGAALEWVALDEALRRCDDGGIVDFKTELALRRLQRPDMHG